MIKPFTCVCMMLAAGSGLYLYQTKHRSQLLDREIARTLKQTEATRERIGVLRGEWALLNEPERLAELTQQHLGLHTLSPTQFSSMADLGNRLPAPLPQGRAAVPAEDGPVPDVVPLAAAAKPVAAPRLAAAPVAATPSAPRPEPAQYAVVVAPPPPVAVPASSAALPLPPAAAVHAAAAAPIAPRVRPAAVQAAPAAVPVPAPPPAPVAVASPAPRPVIPPTVPMLPAPQPRFMAPIMSVSAAPMAAVPAAAAPARIQGLTASRPAPAPQATESTPRLVRAPASVQHAAAPAPAFGASVVPAALGNGYGVAAPVTGSGLGSALGGTRPALPAPVPYGSAPR